MELKILFDDGDVSLEPNRWAVNEEEEPICFLLSISFPSQYTKEVNSQRKNIKKEKGEISVQVKIKVYGRVYLKTVSVVIKIYRIT